MCLQLLQFQSFENYISVATRSIKETAPYFFWFLAKVANICFEFLVLAPPFLVQSVVLPSHFQVPEKCPASTLHLSDLQFESSNLNSHFLICVPSFLLFSNMTFRQFFHCKYYIWTAIFIIYCNRLETTRHIIYCNRLETLVQQMYNSCYMTPLCDPIRGLYMTFLEKSLFKFLFSHKRFQMGQKMYFHQLYKL